MMRFFLAIVCFALSTLATDARPSHYSSASTSTSTSKVELELDRSLGCSAQDNVIIALLIGAFAGVFVCIFPCLYMCMRAHKQWTNDLLDKSNPTVRRTTATICEKQRFDNHEVGAGSRISYTVIIEFKPKRNDGTEVPVRASVGVHGGFFEGVADGSEVEVAYRVGNEREFALPDDIALQQEAGHKHGMLLLGCMGCIFASIGTLIGVGAWPLTGCFLGLVPFVLLITGGTLAGRYVFFPMMKSLRQSRFYVSTEGKATIGETMGRNVAKVQEIAGPVRFQARFGQVSV